MVYVCGRHAIKTSGCLQQFSMRRETTFSQAGVVKGSTVEIPTWLGCGLYHVYSDNCSACLRVRG